jgi:hypothetical protein
MAAPALLRLQLFCGAPRRGYIIDRVAHTLDVAPPVTCVVFASHDVRLKRWAPDTWMLVRVDAFAGAIPAATFVSLHVDHATRALSMQYHGKGERVRFRSHHAWFTPGQRYAIPDGSEVQMFNMLCHVQLINPVIYLSWLLLLSPTSL